MTKRFLEKTKRAVTGCLEWTATLNWKGYGKIFWEGRVQYAHRVAWLIAHGWIPDGVVVCHKCDNRKCVEVEHLFLGSIADNNADMRKKGRHGKGGSRLCPDDVRFIRELYEYGLTQKLIGTLLGLNRATVGFIVTRKTWSDVA